MRALLWIVWAALAVILGWRATTVKAPEIEQDILARTEPVVKALNANAETKVDGRFVTVRGPEPTEEAKAKTLAAANDVWGALGPYDGLWVPAAAKAAEFLSADKTADGKLVLAGSVSSEEAKTAAEAAAKESFSGQIDNQLVVAGTDAPTALGGLSAALKSLSTLDAGSLLALPDRFRLSGTTNDRAVADASNALASSEPAKWSVFVQGPAAAAAAAEPAPAHFSAVKAPNGGIVANGDVPSDADKSSLLDALRSAAQGATVIDRLNVRPEGLPTGWTDRIGAGVKALTGLDWGSLSLDGAQSYINGSGAADKIQGLTDALGAAWTSDVAATPADPNTGKISELEASLKKAQDDAAKAAADAKAAVEKAAADAKAEADRLAASASNTGEETLAAAKAAAAKALADAKAETDAAKAAGEKAVAEAKAAADAAAMKAAEQAAAAQAALKSQVADLRAQLAAKPAVPVSPGEPVDAAKSCNVEMGKVMSGQTIEFDTGSANIKASGRQLLDAIAAAAKPCLRNGLRVEVSGHTDDVGNDDANMTLSQRRAEAVKAALEQRGLTAADITAKGYGETRPVSANDTDAGRAANRRISFDWFVR